MQLEEKARKSAAGLWRAVTSDQMPEWRQERERWIASEAAGRSR
jgi:hypothetical protein